MQGAARKLNREYTRLDEGRVVRTSGQVIVIDVDGFECESRRARSCLVRPEIGDLALVAFVDGSRSFVLAVLESPIDATPVTVSADGDFTITAPRGKVQVRAAKGVDLASGGELNLRSAEMNVSALRGNVVVEKLSVIGEWLKSEVRVVKTIAETLDSVAERISQRTKRSYRHVEELDQLKAGTIDHAAETAMMMRSENTVMISEKIVKVEAAQIQLG